MIARKVLENRSVEVDWDAGHAKATGLGGLKRLSGQALTGVDISKVGEGMDKVSTEAYHQVEGRAGILPKNLFLDDSEATCACVNKIEHGLDEENGVDGVCSDKGSGLDK